MTYCVVPADTDPEVVSALRLEYASDPLVSVILDDRAGEAAPSSATLMQRRPVLRWSVPGSTIPGARMEKHMPPVDVELADLSEPEIVARAAQNDPAAATELRWRCYARVLTALTNRTGSSMNAHALVPKVMDALQRALPEYPPHADFSRWMAGFIAEMSLDV